MATDDDERLDMAMRLVDIYHAALAVDDFAAMVEVERQLALLLGLGTQP